MKFKVDFDSLDWCEGREGVRYKLYVEGGRQLRLVEFSTVTSEPGWCDQGHIGYVLDGSLSIDFGGTVLDFRAGDGLFIPPGAASRHRGTRIASGTRLIMVEDSEG